MRPQQSMKKWVNWATVIGCIVALIALGLQFLSSFDQKDSGQQAVNVGPSGVAAVSRGGNVNIVVNPLKPGGSAFKQPPRLPNEVDYRDLANPIPSRRFIGKPILFRATYISEWNIHQVYRIAGIPFERNIFLNHRDVFYEASESPFGSTDSQIPPFPIAVSHDQIEEVRKLKRGDFILVSGIVISPQKEKSSFLNKKLITLSFMFKSQISGK